MLKQILLLKENIDAKKEKEKANNSIFHEK